MAFLVGTGAAVKYAESRKYTEPLFVFVVMVVAASRPLLEAVRSLVVRPRVAIPIEPIAASVPPCN